MKRLIMVLYDAAIVLSFIAAVYFFTAPWRAAHAQTAPDPQAQIAIQQQMIQRGNGCIDAYRDWIGTMQRLETAQREIERLTKQVAELTKPEMKKDK